MVVRYHDTTVQIRAPFLEVDAHAIWDILSCARSQNEEREASAGIDTRSRASTVVVFLSSVRSDV